MALTPEQLERLKELHGKVGSTAPVKAQEEPSGAKGVAGFGTGIVKSVGKTVLGLGTLGQKMLNAPYKALGGEGTEVPIYTKGTQERNDVEGALKYKSGAEKLGGFAGEVAQFAIPGGAVTKAAKGASALTSLGAKAGTAAAVATAQEGDIGKEALIAGGTEIVLPGVGKVAKGLYNYGAGAVKGLASITTGAGSEALERVLKNPEAGLKGIKGGDEALKESALAIRSGVKTLQKNAGQEYEKVAGAVAKKIDKTKIQQSAFDILQKEADAVVGDDGIKFVNTPFTEAEEKQFAKVYNVINDWTDDSATGINQLARKVSRFRRGSKDSENFDRVIDTIRRNIRTEVGQQVPEIAEANAKYGDKMDLLEQIDKVLKTTGKADSRTGIMQTSTRIAQIFNANKETQRAAVEELEKELGIDVLAQEAGRRFSGGTSQFQIGASDTVMNFVRSVVPKSFIGKVAARTGQTQQFIEKRLADKIEALDPASRAFVVEFMTELFAEE